MGPEVLAVIAGMFRMAFAPGELLSLRHAHACYALHPEGTPPELNELLSQWKVFWFCFSCAFPWLDCIDFEAGGS